MWVFHCCHYSLGLYHFSILMAFKCLFILTYYYDYLLCFICCYASSAVTSQTYFSYECYVTNLWFFLRKETEPLEIQEIYPNDREDIKHRTICRLSDYISHQMSWLSTLVHVRIIRLKLELNPVCNQHFILSVVQKWTVLSLEQSQSHSIAWGQAVWSYLAY